MSKIAYIVLCHKDPVFIKNLAFKLRYKENKIFIAIDNKVEKIHLLRPWKILII